MRILIVRHADPDYEKDSLTEVGWKEAELLAKRLSRLDVKNFYVSPLGRAKDTASLTLSQMNMVAEMLPWPQEFCQANIRRPDVKGRTILWDWLPQDWTAEKKYYDRAKWTETEIMRDSTVKQEHWWVCKGFDDILKKHGYVREGGYYRVEKANTDTIVFFCHFGVECVMLGHLLGISPMILWHGMCAAPSSVTTIHTEERREGIASMRISAFGDVSHLYAAEREPSFAARFCETYDSPQRHD